jgi:hypothetical protein
LLSFHQSTCRKQLSSNKEDYDDGTLKIILFAIYALVLLDKPIFMKPDEVLNSIEALLWVLRMDDLDICVLDYSG